MGFLSLLESESEVARSCTTLRDPTDCSLPGSSVHGIFQARVLEWVAISFSRGPFRPRDRTWVSSIAGDALPSEPPGQPHPCLKTEQKFCCSVTRSCLTLCNPVDCSLPGSSVHAISQARILECIAISFSRGSSQPRD